MMLALGFSINLLTLLALVLAIGLVVDDAIIVVENVNRHLEEGKAPLRRRRSQAARELGGPIIAMTVVLIAVYVPIGFQGGLTGALFTEFAFTLVGAVTISAIVALTLSPMMCSRLLKPHSATQRLAANGLRDFIDRSFDGCASRLLSAAARQSRLPAGDVVFAVIVLSSIYFLYTGAKSELAPQEDQGVVITQHRRSRPNATLQQKVLYARQVYQIMKRISRRPSTSSRSTRRARSIAGMVLKPWDERVKNQQPAPADRAAASSTRWRARASPPFSCRRCRAARACRCSSSSRRPIRSIGSTMSPSSSSGRRSTAECSSSSIRDLKIDNPQSVVEIDRDKAAQLGLKMSDVGGAHGGHAGRRLCQLFQPRSALLQGDPAGAAAFPAQCASNCSNYYIAQRLRRSGPAIDDRDASRPRRCRRRSIIFSSSTAPRSRASRCPASRRPTRWTSCRDLAAKTLPEGYTVDYGGLSRQYIQESSGFVATFGFALIIIFLSLAALFESFRDPMHHPGLGADVDRRRADLRQPRCRRRIAEHLHRGRPGDADGPDQQARRS